MRDKILVPASIALGILFDRLIIAHSNVVNFGIKWSIFWVVFIAIFSVLNYKKLMKNYLVWLIAGLTFMICILNAIYSPDTYEVGYNTYYSYISMLIIPVLTMFYLQFSTGMLSVKQIKALTFLIFEGFVVKPFSAINKLFNIVVSPTDKSRSAKIKRVGIGLLICIPLLAIILPLLAGADGIFNYYLSNIFNSFDFLTTVYHIIISVLATLLFFSTIWNALHPDNEEIKYWTKPTEKNLDRLICAVILCVIIVLYITFCAMQFVFLFAQEGLPAGYTYAEYAREGFWQLVVIAGINLLIFGIFQKYVKQAKWFDGLLIGLIAVTLIMLVSAILRLSLYIDTYGLTWLRLLSMWFIIFLVAVLIFSVLRLFISDLPLIMTSFIVLIAWYVILGMANPNNLIENYNNAHDTFPLCKIDTPVKCVGGDTD